jgi:dinuclear metal center YbgI/SA1388 family protein
MTDIVKVSDIIKKINSIADPGLALEWDNVGLQVGSSDGEVSKIMLTLDVTERSVEFAIAQKVDLIISHHPLIFHSLKSVTDSKLLNLIKHDIAVFCAHTNLDVVKKGVNFALAEKLQLHNLDFLSPETGAELFQISVYVPQDSMDLLAEELFKQGVGVVGNYTHCLNDYEVSGQYKPEKGSNPYLGEKGKLRKITERKLEFFVDSFNLSSVIATIKKFHPYETPVYSIVPQKRMSDNYGLGLIGEIKQEISIAELALEVKNKLEAPYVKLWLAQKSRSTQVKKIAICGGSGSSLIRNTYGRADIFISADFTYHTFLESRIPLIDAGHFYTEYPVLEQLKNVLICKELEIIEFPRTQHEINQQIIL